MASDFTPLRDAYLAAQLRGDRHEALRIVLEDGLSQGLSAVDLQLGVIAEAQREIGRLWQENRITVAQEHVATAVSQLVLAHLLSHLVRKPANGLTVMVACVQGELHEMAPRLVVDVLEAEGYRVHYLGANVPTSSLVHMVLAEGPDVLCLAATMSFHLDALRHAIAEVRAVRGDDLVIVVGGHALIAAPPMPAELRVTTSLGSATDLVTTIRNAWEQSRAHAG